MLPVVPVGEIEMGGLTGLKKFAALATLAAMAMSGTHATNAQPAPTETAANRDAAARAIAESLTPRRGAVAIPSAQATLDLGTAYDFYGEQDAKRILTELWGNPPEASSNVLGLVMPAGASPLSDAWGAAVTYEATGYVSDEDAQSTDYDELLVQMRSGETENNEARAAQGYAAMSLIGWAERPTYDPVKHSVIWAQNIRFADQADNTLNYDVRLLGRRGVLSLNLISSMSQLDQVKQAATNFASKASFDAGETYADYDSSTDAVAEYGVGGLVAAGVGVAAAQKLGIFAVLLKFGKFILIGLFALLAVFRNRIAALFGRKNEEEVDGQP